MKPATPMFRRVNHIGIVVDNLAEARRWLTEAFGLSLGRSVELPEGKIRGEFYTCGEIDIEVIEIGDPEMRRQRLGDGRRARIEHIAVEVDDLGAALARLAPLGVRTTSPTPRRIGKSLHAWTAEETTGGVSYQLTQVNADLPESDRHRE
jgi:methylmalonyl-CoA/ethylmalonyl-CoA epimerase